MRILLSLLRKFVTAQDVFGQLGCLQLVPCLVCGEPTDEVQELCSWLGVWGRSPHSFPGSEFEMILAHRMDYVCGKGKA